MQTLANGLEIFMLVCFGLSWPMAAVKSYKSRSSKSTSLLFILLVLLGYICGVASKFIAGNLEKSWYVLIAYFINIMSVITNIGVYFLNRHREKQTEAKENLNSAIAAESGEAETKPETQYKKFLQILCGLCYNNLRW